ncbi:MAG: helix-turn-helix transcriptional regulator [Gemmatimonadaceae bacterium]
MGSADFVAGTPALQTASNAILGEPRGRLLATLCGHPATAIELAEQVGTTGNAVRVHLGALRDAGLVEFHVERRGVGKPTHVYSLTSAAEYVLSSAYAPALRALLDTLRLQLDGGLETWLKKAGAALARAQPSTTRRVDEITDGIELLRRLGAVVSIETNGRDTIVRTSCCPLGAVTRTTPESCKLLEGALDATLPSHRVRERCERGEHPRCLFVLRAARTHGPR